MNGKKELQHDEELLVRAVECWESLDDFRRERERCKRFTYGDQWNDIIDECGVRMSEEDYILSQGNIPLKNNLIRRLVRNVLGVFRNKWEMPKCVARDPAENSKALTMNTLLEYNMRLNRLDELYARTMEEFLISGMAVHKKWFGLRDGRIDCWTDSVTPGSFFFDTSSRDFRGSDMSLIGEIHEMRLDEIIAVFGKTMIDAERFKDIFHNTSDCLDDATRYRIFEIWERKKILRLNCHDRKTGTWFRTDFSERSSLAAKYGDRLTTGLFTDEQWHYTFLTSDGTVITRGISPYRHGSHPYIFKAYPFIDGEIHSFVSDIIDQQKLTNRLISMYDWILRASAKGVLLFPEGALPAGVDINEVADEWSRFNGVIVYRPKPGIPLPQQISSNSTDIGITGLLEIQMKMMEDISGVNGALQGKLDNGSMSGTLYNQQTRNSLTSLADLLRSYDDFIRKATETDSANIRQYYSPGRIASIIGNRTGYASDLTSTSGFSDSVADFIF